MGKLKDIPTATQKKISETEMYYFDKMPQIIKDELNNSAFGYEVKGTYSLWLKYGTKYTLEILKKGPPSG